MPGHSYRQQLKHQRLSTLASQARAQGLAGGDLWHALGDACADGEDLEIFLGMGGDINARTASGDGLLDRAIRHHSNDYFNALLQAGLDPNQPDREGVSPLFACIQARAVRKARALIDRGVDIQAMHMGRSALFQALESGVFAIAHHLMLQGHDPAQTGPHGKTLLHAALSRRKFRSGVEAAKVLKTLLLSTPLSTTDALGVSCAQHLVQLRPALKKSFWDGVVHRLLDAAEEGPLSLQAVEIPSPGQESFEPASVASGSARHTVITRSKTSSAVRRAIGRGESVDAHDGLGRSALWRAASKGGGKIGLLLLAHGASLGSQDSSTGNFEIHELSRFAAPDFLDALIAADPAQVHLRNFRGRTPLHLAAHHSRPQMCARLLDAGAGVNEQDDKGNTPLHEVANAAYGNTDIARHEVFSMLLDRGADPFVRNSEGLTPLGILEQRLGGADGPLLVAFLRQAQAHYTAQSLAGQTVDPAGISRNTRRI